jgi:hypothetical protein
MWIFARTIFLVVGLRCWSKSALKNAIMGRPDRWFSSRRARRMDRWTKIRVGNRGVPRLDPSAMFPRDRGDDLWARSRFRGRHHAGGNRLGLEAIAADAIWKWKQFRADTIRGSMIGRGIGLAAGIILGAIIGLAISLPFGTLPTGIGPQKITPSGESVWSNTQLLR